MSRIKGKDTKPELLVRSMLYRMGYRFRVQGAKLPGRPDIVFSARRKVIQVHGCFWHRHDCPNGRSMPSTRKEFWMQKFRGNVERDARNLEKLESLEWSCLTLWECEIKNDIETCCKLRCFLGSSRFKSEKEE